MQPSPSRLVPTNVDFAALEQAIAETKLCDLRRRLRPPKTQLDGSLSDLSDLSDVSDVESADRSIRLIPLPGAISSEGRALDGLFDGPLSDLSETSETEDIEASVNNIHSKRALSTHASSKNTAQCPPRNTRVRPSVVGISTNVPKTSSRSTRSVQPSSALGPPPCVSAASNRSTQPRTQRSLARSRDGQSSTPTRHRQASANSNLDVKPPKPRPTKSLPQCSPMALSRLRVASTTSSLPLPPPPPSFAFIPSTAMVSSPPRKKQRRRKPQTVEAKALAKARKNRNRTERRRREERFHGLKDIWVKHMRQTKVYILRNFDITKTRVGTGGWRGSSVNVYEPTQTIQDAIEKGYEEFEWDGSVNIVFLDCMRRFIILLRKRDASQSGLERQQRMTSKLEVEGTCALLKNRKGKGEFGALRGGIVHSGGSSQPRQVFNVKTNYNVLRRIFTDPDFVYDAHQTDVALRMWNPNLHAALWDVREALTTQLDTEHLEWNYTHLPYALTTVNFGKQTVCDTHMDDKDFAFMQSVLKCFGSFDYRKGGHLLFPSLKLAVQFPQGAEAYFPTARLPHANTRIGPSEKRYSITSYSSGGHFEWAYRGGLHKYGWQEYLRTHELEEAEDARDAERPALLTERFFPIWH